MKNNQEDSYYNIVSNNIIFVIPFINIISE
jgi:hypothetical protein